MENAAAVDDDVQVPEVSSTKQIPGEQESYVRRRTRRRSAEGLHFYGDLTSEVSMFTRFTSGDDRPPPPPPNYDVAPGFRAADNSRAIGERALDFCGLLGTEVSVFRRRRAAAALPRARRRNVFQNNALRAKTFRPTTGPRRRRRRRLRPERDEFRLRGNLNPEVDNFQRRLLRGPPDDGFFADTRPLSNGARRRLERDDEFRLCGNLNTEVAVFERHLRGPDDRFFINTMSDLNDTFEAFGLDFRFHWQLTSEVSIRKFVDGCEPPEGKIS